MTSLKFPDKALNYKIINFSALHKIEFICLISKTKMSFTLFKIINVSIQKLFILNFWRNFFLFFFVLKKEGKFSFLKIHETKIDIGNIDSDIYSMSNRFFIDPTDSNRYLISLNDSKTDSLKLYEFKIENGNGNENKITCKENCKTSVDLKDVKLAHDWKIKFFLTWKSRYMVFSEPKCVYNNLNKGEKLVYYVDPYKNKIIGKIEMPDILEMGTDFHDTVVSLPDSDDTLAKIGKTIYIIKLDGKSQLLKYEKFKTYDREIDWIQMTTNKMFFVVFHDHTELFEFKLDENGKLSSVPLIINKKEIRGCWFSNNKKYLLTFTINKELSMLKIDTKNKQVKEETSSLTFSKEVYGGVISDNYVSVMTEYNQKYTLLSFEIIDHN